jgi:hypothetical protein
MFRSLVAVHLKDIHILKFSTRAVAHGRSGHELAGLIGLFHEHVKLNGLTMGAKYQSTAGHLSFHCFFSLEHLQLE